ncbi:MAG: betaine/proline/choline family ABC transporter ATP-binding protein [Ectothiorhodospiraceae bacterium]|nr:betaine/proline/choline family ABC transporter ATP-binding protein [Ectothiorhodospiraceae bacterium]
MIRAEGVSKIFGPQPASIMALLEQGKSKSEIQQETGHVVGVNNASFAIAPGEVFVIMGLSGSGKSTLIRCVNRIIEPTGGRILFKDPEAGELDVTTLDYEQLRMLRKQHMSMVFQHFALFPHRTVLSNATYGLEIQRRPDSARKRIGQEVLDMVGLGEWGQAYPSELSGGMQQRVGLARALATQARVLLMDEPFSALDPLIKVNMQQELKRIQQELQRTILFITHDLDEAMRIGDRIAIMEDGEIIQIGSPEEILVNPRTEYVARFVEHADPTGVITAGTIALPFTSSLVQRVGNRYGLQYFARRGYPRLRYGQDSTGRLKHVMTNERELPVQPLEQVIEARAADHLPERRDDLILTCPETTVLRQVLRGRLHSALPIVVTDRDGRIRGLVDDPELISGILEKRGHFQQDTVTTSDCAP